MKLAAFTQRKFFAEFEPLLHRVLHDAYIEPNYLFYDDLLQELRLKLLEIADQFDGHPLGTDRFRFVAYARRGLMWYLRDLMPKFQAQHGHGDDALALATEYKLETTSSAFVLNFLEEAKRVLSQEDFLLLRLWGIEDYSIQDLCDVFECSRQTIYQRRRRIAKKMSHLKELLV